MNTNYCSKGLTTKEDSILQANTSILNIIGLQYNKWFMEGSKSYNY
jgi:hypothetical protein